MCVRKGEVICICAEEESSRTPRLSPSVGCWARPASADRLVPARSSPWLLTLPQPRNRWREESKGGKRGEIAPCSALGTSSGCECLQLVYCTPHAAMLFRAALKKVWWPSERQKHPHKVQFGARTFPPSSLSSSQHSVSCHDDP